MNKRIERTFVLAKVLEAMGSAWFFGSYTLFVQGLGMSLFQLNLLNTIFMALSSLLDPFSGNWGDRIGQKRIYMTGSLSWAVGHLMYWRSVSFWGCAGAEGVSAVGHACRSEALESWMKNHCDEETSHKAITKAGVWARLATIPTALAGGFIAAKFGLEWPWFLAGITSLAVLAVSYLQLRDLPERAEDCQASGDDLQLWIIAKKCWKDPVLRRSFIATAILTASFQPFNMFWPVVFKDAAQVTEWTGGLWIGIALTSALGNKLAQKWKISSKGLSLIIASIGIPMLLPQLPGNWIVMILIPFLVHEIGRSMWVPVLWTYTNRRIGNQTRSSVNSLRSSAGTAGAMAGLLLSGYLTTWLTPTQVWGISAIALLIVSLWVWRWNHD